MPNHPLMEKVHTLSGGRHSYHVTGAVNESGASTVARWSNGIPLMVVLDHHQKVERGRVVSLNILPCPKFKTSQHKDEYWGMILTMLDIPVLTIIDALTDGAVMIANALRFTAEPTYQKDKGLYLCEECVRVFCH